MSSYKILLTCCVVVLMTANQAIADTLESQLIRMSELGNSRLPMLINKDVRIDTSYALGTKFVYINTLLNDSSTEIPLESLSALRKQIINGICSHEGLSDFSRRGANFVYMYRNNQGSYIAEITIPAYECND